MKVIITFGRKVQLEDPDFLNTRGGKSPVSGAGVREARAGTRGAGTGGREAATGGRDAGTGPTGTVPESPLSRMSQLVSVLLIFMIKDSSSSPFLLTLKEKLLDKPLASQLYLPRSDHGRVCSRVKKRPRSVNKCGLDCILKGIFFQSCRGSHTWCRRRWSC